MVTESLYNLIYGFLENSLVFVSWLYLYSTVYDDYTISDYTTVEYHTVKSVNYICQKVYSRPYIDHRQYQKKKSFYPY